MAAVCLAAVWLSVAHAETAPSVGDRALATTLFQEGRALMAAGRLEEACPKLAESQRLDPSGGTLLNLALCDERAGRLGRAVSEFTEAASVARREGRGDREAEALARVRAIEPRLPRAPASAPTQPAPASTRVTNVAPPVAPPAPLWVAIGAGLVGVVGVGLLLLIRVRVGDRRRI